VTVDVSPVVVVAVGGWGAVVAPTTMATRTNSGAITSAATARRRLVAVPLRRRRNAAMAGMIMTEQRTNPNPAVAGTTANTAPRMTSTKVTAPRRLRGDGDGPAGGG
jgi:hypothetical protein